MKNAKIFAISSVLAILLTACGSAPSESNTNQNPGFTYDHPTDTFVEPNNTKIDFSGNDVIKKVLLDLPKDDASKERKKEWFTDALETIDKNQIVPNKVTYDLVNYDVRDYTGKNNGLDLKNKEMEFHYSVERNTETYGKTGTFTFKKQTTSLQPKDVNDPQSEKVVKKDPLIDDAGTYAYVADLTNKKYTDKITFTKGGKPEQVKEGTLSWTNLNKAMLLSDLTVFKHDCKELVKYVDSKPQFGEKFVYDAAYNIEKVGEDVKISLVTTLKTKGLQGEALLENNKSFYIIFAKDGFVKETYLVNEDFQIDSATTKKSLEKNEQKYTFSL